MKLSVIICTRNRGYAITGCLDSIVESIKAAGPVEAEIVVVDNGSTDDTPVILKNWRDAADIPVKVLTEPNPGLSRARNCAVRAAEGDLLAFTDDDCRYSRDYVTQLLAYDAADVEPVIRGGRVELGDSSDLPLTINLIPLRINWSRARNSARSNNLGDLIAGCNMALRRTLADRIGPFDENLGAGARIAASEDTDYAYRAYLAGAALEHVPDMTVQHFHGRKTREQGRKLLLGYLTGNGALYMKYMAVYPLFLLPFYWDLKGALRALRPGGARYIPEFDITHGQMIMCRLRGAIQYLFLYRRGHAGGV